MNRTTWVFWFLLVSLPLQAGTPQVLGVLEQPQSETIFRPMARLLFAKEGKDWIPLDHGLTGSARDSLGRSRWQVVRDGHGLGWLQLRDPDPSHPDPSEAFYTRDKLFELVDRSGLPLQANDGKAFGGWIRVPSIRPQVLLSQAVPEARSGWRAFKPDASYRVRLLRPLKGAFKGAAVVHCASNDAPAVTLEVQPKLLVLYAGYRSAKGEELLSVGLNPDLYKCDGLMDPEWSDHWFLIDGSTFTFLGRERELVDIGDYDQDGQPEFLFWHSGYDEDGYVLVYEHFRKQATYLWNYH